MWITGDAGIQEFRLITSQQKGEKDKYVICRAVCKQEKSCLPRRLPWYKVFFRLRLGHTSITHTHLLNENRIQPCPYGPYCNSSTLSTIHLLDECPYFNSARTILFSEYWSSWFIQSNVYCKYYLDICIFISYKVKKMYLSYYFLF